jgi:hypothetical protein
VLLDFRREEPTERREENLESRREVQRSALRKPTPQIWLGDVKVISMAHEPSLLSLLKTLFSLPISPHLHTGGAKMSADQLLLLKEASALASQKGLEEARESSLVANLAMVSEEQIRKIAADFGEEGVFKLNFLAFSMKESDFEHFFEIVASDLAFRELRNTPRLPLELDNGSLRAAPELNDYNHNVVSTSLSRKLFNPGRREGYLVYGIGGPRILVSLPHRARPSFSTTCTGTLSMW